MDQMQNNHRSSQASQASQKIQQFINSRKKHNEKALKIRQRQKEQGHTIKEIMNYINSYFYDHDEQIKNIKCIEDIDIKYIKKILKYMCRDSLYLEKYSYKIRSDDPEDIKELKEILMKKNINIINKSKFDIFDLKKSMRYLTEIFTIDYEMNENIKETVLKMLFIYLDDDNERYFNIDLETGENDDENEFEQDLFLLLVNFIYTDENKNITHNNRLPDNLYMMFFKPSINDPEFKYKVDEYSNKYFMIFEFINKVSKNIYDIYVYKINYILNRSFGVSASNKYIYNFDSDDIQKERINNFFINQYVKINTQKCKMLASKYFFYDNIYGTIDFLDEYISDDDPIIYFKYFLTPQNKNDYETIYNNCIAYKRNINYFNNLFLTDDFTPTNLLNKYKDRIIGDYNSIEILKNEKKIDCRLIDTFYSWASLNKYHNIIEYINMIIFILDVLKNDRENVVYNNELLEYKNKLYCLINNF